MPNLQRISTQYQSAEDRMLLTGEFSTGSTVSLWLTQRLMLRVVPLLVEWLQKQSPTDLKASSHSAQAQDIAQTFSRPAVKVTRRTAAEASAAASSDPQPEPDTTENIEALIHSIDLTTGARAVRLKFKDANKEVGSVVLNPGQLRQWLAVLQVLWRRADWQGGIWPSWLKTDADLATTRSKGAMH